MDNFNKLTKNNEVSVTKINQIDDALIDVFIDIIIDSFLEKRSKSVTKSDTIISNSN